MVGLTRNVDAANMKRPADHTDPRALPLLTRLVGAGQATEASRVEPRYSPVSKRAA